LQGLVILLGFGKIAGLEILAKLLKIGTARLKEGPQFLVNRT